MADSNQLSWRSSTFADGVGVKDLGTVDGYTMQLVKFNPGATFPAHNHIGSEFIFILEGKVIQNGKELTTGWSSLAPAGSSDNEFRSEVGCTFLLIFKG